MKNERLIDAKEMANLERYVDLACGIVNQAKTDYIEALKTIMENYEQYKPLSKQYDKWLDYNDMRKQYERIMKKKPKNRKEQEKKIVKNFKRRKVVNELSKKELNFIKKVENAIYVKIDNESFFKSSWFQLLTLYQGIDPKLLINELKAQAGWKREY